MNPEYDDLLSELIPDFQRSQATVQDPNEWLIPDEPTSDNIIDSDIQWNDDDEPDDAANFDFPDDPDLLDGEVLSEEEDNIAEFVYRDLQRITNQIPNDKLFDIRDGLSQIKSRIYFITTNYQIRDNELLVEDMITTTIAMLRQINTPTQFIDPTIGRLKEHATLLPFNYREGVGLNMFALALAILAKKHMRLEQVWKLWSHHSIGYRIYKQDIIRYFSYVR